MEKVDLNEIVRAVNVLGEAVEKYEKSVETEVKLQHYNSKEIAYECLEPIIRNEIPAFVFYRVLEEMKKEFEGRATIKK